tara:strand:+ start:267 stop:440 length:174 start_codon:yes stop_codon:yes gene_type:complete
MKFGLFIKYGGLSKDNMVFSTYKENLEQAKQHFMNLKRLSEVEFNKLFIVAKIESGL